MNPPALVRLKGKFQRIPSHAGVKGFEHADAVSVSAVSITRGQPKVVPVIRVNPNVCRTQRSKGIDAQHLPVLTGIQRMPESARWCACIPMVRIRRIQNQAVYPACSSVNRDTSWANE